MRIAQFIPSMAREYGGPATYVTALSRQLALRGHESVVFAGDFIPDDHGAVSALATPVEVRKFTSTLRFRDYAYTPGMRQSATGDRFDIVQANGYRNYQADVAAWLARKEGRPMVLTTHGTATAFLGREDLLIKRAYDVLTRRKALRTASAIVAVSRREATELIDFGVPEDKVHRIPLGVDTDFYKPSIQDRSFLERYGMADDTMLLYVGRIHPIKGLETLVRCFAKIVEDRPSVRLLMIGPENNYSGKLRALAARLGVEKGVILTGSLSREDLRKAYNSCVCLLLPSTYEVFGLVLLEAGACGKPCIATSTGGAVDIISDGENGILLSSMTERELYDAVMTLLTDETLRRRMELAARRRTERDFSWHACADAHEELYRSLLRGDA